MKIEDLMTTAVRVCAATDSLSVAAQAMWDNDCGCLPVIDGERRVIGMITDRDICMSAHLRGVPLHALAVGEAMAKVVYGCKPGDKLGTAAEMLAEHQLRRLPVVDDTGRLVGLVTLSALTHAATGKRKKKSSLSPKDLVEVVSTVTSPRAQPVTHRSVIEVQRAPKVANAATLTPKPRATKARSAPTPALKDKKSRTGK